MSNFKLSAFADEYADSFDEQLSALNRFGISHIELRHLDGINISLLPTEQIIEAKKKMDTYGIRASAIGSPLGKIKLDADINAHLETAKRVFETANIMDTRFVRIFSFYAPDGMKITGMKNEVTTALYDMVSLAEKYGVTLCHENEACIYGDTPARCRDLLDCFDGKLKCVFDMGNFVLEGINPYPEAYEILKKDIAYFHIKDALADGAIVPPGKGDAKIKEIISAHKEYSTDDFIVSLEPHLQTFSGLNALVGRSFNNPYKYENTQFAFTDAVTKIRELI